MRHLEIRMVSNVGEVQIMEGGAPDGEMRLQAKAHTFEHGTEEQSFGYGAFKEELLYISQP